MDASREDEFKSIVELYDRLSGLSKAARGFLAYIVLRGQVRRGRNDGRISIVSSELQAMTERVNGGSGHFGALDDAGLAHLDDGDWPQMVVVGWALDVTGIDFFVALKKFCQGNERKLRHVLEDCAFDALDD